MTYVNDPIGDLLTRMRNAQKANRQTCTAPWSSIKQELCELLKKGGWLEDVQVTTQKPALTLKRMSKPGRRIYMGADDLKPVLRGFGIAVLTTSEGLLTDKEAKKKHVGGEVLCTIF